MKKIKIICQLPKIPILVTKPMTKPTSDSKDKDATHMESLNNVVKKWSNEI
jgi:hypothetical protein